MNNPSVTIIILNWNGKDYLKDCLDSIQDNTSYPNYDLLVVDNNSDDRSVEMVKNKFPDVQLVENSRNLGFSIGNNIGMSKADSDYYLLLNNDTKTEERWLSELVETAEENEAGITGSKLLYSDRTIQHAGAKFDGKTIHYGRGESEDNYSQDRSVEMVTGACFLIREEVIDDIGYLDEVFSPASFEDTDYCRRTREAGYDVFYSASSKLFHYEGKSRDKEPNNFSYFTHRKNRIKYILMNEPLREFPKDFIPEFKALIGAIVGYKHNPLIPLFQAYKEVIFDLPHIVRRRIGRDRYIPSYYLENIKDFSERY